MFMLVKWSQIPQTKVVEEMDPLDFLTDEQLLQFLHCKKTEMSVLKPTHIFLNQLRDHNLLPEGRYQKLMRKRTDEQRQRSMYDALDWLETNRAKHIKVFWECVFQDLLLHQYPTLRLLRNSLMDGSFTFSEKLPEKVEEAEEEDRKNRKTGPGDKEEKMQRKKKKRIERGGSSEEEPAGPSSQCPPSQKKKKPPRPKYASPLKSGRNDIWNWALYRTQLPVTCGDKEGTLNRNKLAKGEKCIMVKNESFTPTGFKWFTPSGFEEFAGKKSSRNWKCSIRCGAGGIVGPPLMKLIQEGHLECSHFRKNRSLSLKTKRKLFHPNQSDSSTIASDSESEDEEEEEEEEESDGEGNPEKRREEKDGRESTNTDEESSEDGGRQTVLQVTCGTVSGTLHKDRFATETFGKSIRTEECWMTPMEFLRAGSALSDDWRRDIQYEGRPLSTLIEEEVLTVHSFCECKLCTPSPQDLDEQKNDDECFICRSMGDMVMCEQCPRSFHKECHLPRVDDAILRNNCRWKCTFCVFRDNQRCLYPSEKTLQEAQSCCVSGHLLECQYLLLYMYNADEEQIFATDSCLDVNGYTRLIKAPMWLDKVVEKLQQNLYQTVDQLVNDILLIFDNCATFNKHNAEFREMGIKLKELFRRKFKSVFSVQQ